MIPELRGGAHPVGALRDGDHRHLRQGAVLRGRRRDAAGHRRVDPDGASPGKERTGCSPDAADARIRGRCPRDESPSPARVRRGCSRGAVHHRGEPRRDARQQPAGSPDGARDDCRTPARTAVQAYRATASPVRELPVPGLQRPRCRPRRVMPAARPERELLLFLPEPWAREPPGRMPRELPPQRDPGVHPAWGVRAQPVAPERRLAVQPLPWLRRGRRREVSSRRALRWWMRLNGRIRPVPAASQLRLSRLYRALWRVRVRGPWPHFSCLGPHRVRHEPSISC